MTNLITKDELNKALLDISKKAEEQHFYFFPYVTEYTPDWDTDENGNTVAAIEIAWEINWGDWKHEHARSVDIMIDALIELLPEWEYSFDEEVTEEDGSDTYSSIHSVHCMG